MAATLSSTHYKLDSCGIIPVLLAEHAVRRVLVISDHDDTPSPTKSWQGWWFTNSTPAGGVVGISWHGEIGSSAVAPLKLVAGTTTGITIGESQLPFDRTNSQGSGNDLRLGYVYDTLAPLSGDISEGQVYAKWMTGRFHEVMWTSPAPANGQVLMVYELDADSAFGVSWAAQPIHGLISWHEPFAYVGTTGTIEGGPMFDVVSWRGSGAKAASVRATGGTTGAFRAVAIGVPGGSGVPRFGIAHVGTNDNARRRMLTHVGYLESTVATSGLGIIHSSVPYTSPYNWSGAGNHYVMQATANGSRSNPNGNEAYDNFPALGFPIHAAIVCLCQYITAPEPYTDADPDSDDYNEIVNNLQHYPNGHYIESFEDMLDRVQTNLEPGGVVFRRPVMYVLSHFHGYGDTVALAQTYLERMKQEFIDSLDLQPGQQYYRQFGLKDRACFVDPWVGITPTMILTGQGAGKYIRRNGTTLKGTYSGATAYSVGDVVCYPAASNYSKGNSGWYVCVASTTGTAPPDTGKWAEVDFALNDNGMKHVVDFIWNLVTTVEDVSPVPAGALRDRGSFRMRIRQRTLEQYP